MLARRGQVQGLNFCPENRISLRCRGHGDVSAAPNGSGKSNIADAIRWVLGEQRYSGLRGRKTEDMIFAGSALKPPMGFAEASITFDNSDSKLPLDFSEVTITRRAYRSGESRILHQQKPGQAQRHYRGHPAAVPDLYRHHPGHGRRRSQPEAGRTARPFLKTPPASACTISRRPGFRSSLAKQEDNARHIQAMLAEVEPRLKGWNATPARPKNTTLSAKNCSPCSNAFTATAGTRARPPCAKP